MINLTEAILAVMKAVKGIDKSMTVGSGNSAYKGVADKDVKTVIGEAMEANGLVLLPIGIDSKTEVSRWDETNQYGTKSKQSVFTEVTTKYLLMHSSGESMEVAGYGHGVDSQDKSAGKATTYAMKNTLLYMFMVPTGKIDDADNEHSEDKAVPPTDKRPFINDKALEQAITRIKKGEKDLKDKTIKAFQFSEKQLEKLIAA